MKPDWNLTPESFERLLTWLDSDRDRAGEKYEKIRLRLTRIFTCRGCFEAVDLADETINRVTAKLGELVDTYVGDPALYFYGVAQRVHLEYLRKKSVMQQLDESQRPSAAHEASERRLETVESVEADYLCLERCMEQLSEENRWLVLQYYHEDKQAKIQGRRRLADQLGIGVNALRIRAHRIRMQLQQCVQHCLEESPAH